MYSMVMTTNSTKTSTIVVGMLSGALITAALAAFDFWIFTYTDPRTGFLGAYASWALFAAMIGGIGGFMAGALLGLFLSMRRRGLLFGALAGVIEGFAIALLLLVPEGLSTGDTREDLTVAAFVPIGAISGFLTSLIVSAMTSPTERRVHSYAVLGLQQQNNPDEKPPMIVVIGAKIPSS